MEPREIIKVHFELCERVYEVLLEENSWLKLEKKAPVMEFLERKSPSLADWILPANLKNLNQNTSLLLMILKSS